MGPGPPSAVLKSYTWLLLPCVGDIDPYLDVIRIEHYSSSLSAEKVIHKLIICKRNHFPSSPQYPAPKLKQACSLNVQLGDAFWQDRILTWGFSLFIRNMSVLICLSTIHKPRSREDVDSQQVSILLHTSSIPIQPRPKAWYESGTARRRSGQDAWSRSPGFWSSPSQALVGW